jgi:hypothetical protein
VELAPLALCAVGVIVTAISVRLIWKTSRPRAANPPGPGVGVASGPLSVASSPAPGTTLLSSSVATASLPDDLAAISVPTPPPMRTLDPTETLSNGDREDVPTFRIVALGLSGSGKTVFLSSLFHELHHPMANRPYFLTASMKQRDILSTLHNEVVAPPPQPWPPGTRIAEVGEFTLDGVYCYPNGRRQTVMRIEYLDYDGDLLGHGGWTYRQHPALEAKIGHAHALLGMLDGSKVRDVLLRKPGADNYLESELDPMIGILNQASCPVHLVVTKWDLVRDYGEHPRASDDERLRDVADSLMRHRHVAALPNARPGPPVRLIPVSAVGPDFADLDSAGMSQKRVGGVVDPKNLDVPLCAVLPDLFKRVEQALDEPARRRLASARTMRNIADLFNDQSFLVLLRELLPSPVAASTRFLLAWINRRAKLSESRDDDPEQQAHEQIMRHFVDRIERFQGEFPSSNLSTRRR